MPHTVELEVPQVFEPLLAPARYKGAFGGRGGGKSHFFAGLLVVRALARPAFRAVCVREVQRSLEQSVKRLIEDKIKSLEVGAHFRVLNTHIETPGGGIIIFQGMQSATAENIKSLEGFDVAWVEEAHALSEPSLDLLRPTIREEGSELWFSWNPLFEDDPVDQLLRGENCPPSAVVVKVSWRDNPFLPDVLRSEIEWDRQRHPEKYEHVWEGGYQPEGLGLFRREWFEIVSAAPVEARRCRGWDTASTPDGGDWTVGVRMAMTDNGLLYVEDVVRGQWGPGDVDAIMRQTAALDGIECRQREEREGGASGKTVIAMRIKSLAGFDYAGIGVTRDKATRATPLATQAQAGNVKLVRGDWNQDYIAELTSFPNGRHDDQVDGSSAAANALMLEREAVELKVTF